MNTIQLNLPLLQKVMDKLEVIDSKLESIGKQKSLVEVWLNTKEAAQTLNVTTRTLQSYRDQALLPFSQFGREIRYRSTDIQDFLMDHYVKSLNQKGGCHG